MHRSFLKRMGVWVGVGVLLFSLGCGSPAWGRKNDEGMASWYGESHRNRPMANGEPFNPDKLTAASWFYPMGTRVQVSHAGRSVTVKITDRGPAERLVREGRIIDLSQAAFARLGDLDDGLIDVRLKTVQTPDKSRRSPGRR